MAGGEVAAGRGALGLLVEAVPHAGGLIGVVVQTAVGRLDHRAVLGILAQGQVQCHGGKARDAAQGVEPVRGRLEGAGLHLAGGVGSGGGGGRVKDLLRKGQGTLRQEGLDLLLGELLHVQAPAVPVPGLPGHVRLVQLGDGLRVGVAAPGAGVGPHALPVRRGIAGDLGGVRVPQRGGGEVHLLQAAESAGVVVPGGLRAGGGRGPADGLPDVAAGVLPAALRAGRRIRAAAGVLTLDAAGSVAALAGRRIVLRLLPVGKVRVRQGRGLTASPARGDIQLGDGLRVGVAAADAGVGPHARLVHSGLPGDGGSVEVAQRGLVVDPAELLAAVQAGGDGGAHLRAGELFRAGAGDEVLTAAGRSGDRQQSGGQGQRQQQADRLEKYVLSHGKILLLSITSDPVSCRASGDSRREL